MGLFNRKQAATAAQLGAASDPAAHAAGAVVLATAQDGTKRDELADVPDASPFAGASVLRRAGAGGTPVGPPTEGGNGSTDAQAHVGGGHANPRQAQAGYAGSVDTTTGEPLSPEQLVNTTVPVGMREQAAPPRPRAGLTGEDPARPAVTRLWLFLRPFDKWAADRLAPDGFGKLERTSPLASLPISQAGPTAHANPSPGGSGRTGMDPVGASRNSFRAVPAPWDENLTVPVQAAVAPTQRRGYRA